MNDAVVIGEQERGLYKLKGQLEQALVQDSVDPSELWHRRLAHVHYRALPLARKVVEGLLEIQAKHEGVGDIYHHTHSFGQIGLVKPLS